MKKTIFVLMSILMVTSLVLSACSQSKTTEPAVDEQGYPMDQAPVDQADQGAPSRSGDLNWVRLSVYLSCWACE